ncbi:MAG: Ig-like domain-containing protein, partial [Pseudomonadales bacterium]
MASGIGAFQRLRAGSLATTLLLALLLPMAAAADPASVDPTQSGGDGEYVLIVNQGDTYTEGFLGTDTDGNVFVDLWGDFFFDETINPGVFCNDSCTYTATLRAGPGVTAPDPDVGPVNCDGLGCEYFNPRDADQLEVNGTFDEAGDDLYWVFADNGKGEGLSDPLSFFVRVNGAPTITSTTFNVNENLTAVGQVAHTDPNGDLGASFPESAIFSIPGGIGADDAAFAIDSVTGALSFTSAPDYENPTDVHGTAGDNIYGVNVRVTDGFGLTHDQLITVEVAPVNDNPVVAVADSMTLDEGATETALDSTDTSLLDNDTDVDLPNDTLTVTLVNGLATVGSSTPTTNGDVTVQSDGTFSYTHDGSENFSDSFTYTVSDGINTDTATVSITINPVNDNPVVGVDDSMTLDEGATETALDSTD